MLVYKLVNKCSFDLLKNYGFEFKIMAMNDSPIHIFYFDSDGFYAIYFYEFDNILRFRVPDSDFFTFNYCQFQHQSSKLLNSLLLDGLLTIVEEDL